MSRGAQPGPPCTLVRAPGWKVQRVLWLNCTRTSPRSVMRCTVPICPIHCGGSRRLWPGGARGRGSRGWGGGHGDLAGGAAHLGHPGVPSAVALLHVPQDVCIQQTLALVPVLEGLAVSTHPAPQLCRLAWERGGSQGPSAPTPPLPSGTSQATPGPGLPLRLSQDREQLGGCQWGPPIPSLGRCSL